MHICIFETEQHREVFMMYDVAGATMMLMFSPFLTISFFLSNLKHQHSLWIRVVFGYIAT